jgi:hypothetical protein
MNRRSINPTLPIGLSDIRRLAADAMAACGPPGNSEPDDNSDKTASHRSQMVLPDASDWVSIGDNLLCLSRDFLSRSYQAFADSTVCFEPSALLLQALTRRYLAAENTRTMYGSHEYLAAARAFIRAIGAHDAMLSRMRSCGDLRILANAGTMATSLPSSTLDEYPSTLDEYVGSYWVCVNKIDIHKRVTNSMALARIAHEVVCTHDGDPNSFVVLVDNVNSMQLEHHCRFNYRERVHICGDINHINFVIFVAALNEPRERATTIYVDDVVDVGVKRSALRDMFIGQARRVEKSIDNTLSGVTIGRNTVAINYLHGVHWKVVSGMKTGQVSKSTVSGEADDHSKISRARQRLSSRQLKVVTDNSVVTAWSDRVVKGEPQRKGARNYLPRSHDDDGLISSSRVARQFFGYKGLGKND